MEVTFRVFGSTREELDRKAFEELKRFDDADAGAWCYDIDATAVQLVSGDVVCYEGRVTAHRLKGDRPRDGAWFLSDDNG